MIQKYKDFTPEIHDSCYIAPGAAVIGNVSIGKNSSVWHNAVIRGDIEKITIGENSNIQECSILHCMNDMELIVGNNVTIGHGVNLHSCIIDDNSLIGIGAIVLDSAKVGRNCLVGAGAVVTPNTVIPDNSLVLGSPAKVKREITEQEITHMKKGITEYLKLAGEYKESEIKK